jgi:hypothetical protein
LATEMPRPLAVASPPSAIELLPGPDMSAAAGTDPLAPGPEGSASATPDCPSTVPHA